MTTRAHLADGSTFDIDEETEGKFTHLNGVAVDHWSYVGPTPEDWGRDENGNVTGSAGTAPAPVADGEPAGTK